MLPFPLAKSNHLRSYQIEAQRIRETVKKSDNYALVTGETITEGLSYYLNVDLFRNHDISYRYQLRLHDKGYRKIVRLHWR